MDAKKLSEYRAKRNFSVTREPSGEVSVEASECPRYVIQKHDATRLHFDLRLELDGVFRSWAIAKRPSLDPAVKRLAVEVEDHPLDYGDFEGVIPEEAYGGGTVMIWDSGTWASDDEDARRALAKGELKFHLNGEKLRGDWALVRMKNNQKRYGKSNWLLIKRRDGFARQEQEADDVEGRSAASGRTMAEIADRPLDRPAAKTAPARKPSRSKPAKKPAADSQPAIVMGVAISHPERQLWPPFNAAPAVSKLDLARYLEWAGPSMIDHIEGRPCAILRAPEGIARSSFFQRHAIAGMSGLVKLINVPGEERPFLRIDTVESLIMLAQFGAIEFHPSNCKPGNPMRPGRLVFDLDPGPSVEFSTTIAAAKELRDRLNKLGLIAFCKTSGGKGLHVVTPLKATTNSNAGWTEARSLAETICRQMAADSPDLYVIGMAKRIRKGRIFLDFLRNDLMASSVAPFSPRARPAATVSMPLSWSQLRNDLNPTRYTIHTVPKLIKRTSAWKDYADAERPLAPALKRLRTTA